MKKYARRKFLGKASKGSLFLLTPIFLKNSLGKSSSKPLDNSRVVIVEDPFVLSGSTIIQPRVQGMVDDGIRALTDITDVGEAWKSLFPGITQNSVISIKVNSINRYLPSHPEVAYSIVNGLTSMQVEGSPFPDNNIIIYDRLNSELSNSGYTINTGTTGVRCFGTDEVGFASQSYTVNGQSQQLSSIIDQSNYIINLSVLKGGTYAGVTLSMKNHYGSCSQPSTLHTSRCDPYMPALNALPQIRDKQVICICDAIFGTATYSVVSPQFTPNRIIFSPDPVAHDYISAEILRTEYNCDTVGKATYIATATQAPFNLGTNDPNQIDLIEIISDINDHIEPHYNPDRFRLFQNYPNPFNSQTTIPYQLFKPANVKINIYDIKGVPIRNLKNDNQNVGYYMIIWDGKNNEGNSVASGTYICNFKIDDIQENLRLQLLK